MTRADLETLAQRVEREEPSRKLDRIIKISGKAAGVDVPPHPVWYTTSLDAAASLVKEGWRWLVQDDGIALLKCITTSHLLPGHKTARGHAPKRPAAALTAAALRALAMEVGR